MRTGRDFFTSREEAGAWITPETRLFVLPDGSVKSVPGFESTWQSLDFILKTGAFTEKRVIELGIDLAHETGKQFEDEFAELINYIHGQIRKAIRTIDGVYLPS